MQSVRVRVAAVVERRLQQAPVRRYRRKFFGAQLWSADIAEGRAAVEAVRVGRSGEARRRLFQSARPRAVERARRRAPTLRLRSTCASFRAVRFYRFSRFFLFLTFFSSFFFLVAAFPPPSPRPRARPARAPFPSESPRVRSRPSGSVRRCNFLTDLRTAE